MKIEYTGLICLGLLAGLASAEIEPTWKSMAANYQPPKWFQDGKIGVWMHWGIPSSIDENRPNDGSHYGRRMYGDKDFSGAPTMQSEMTRKLSEWHVKRYGPFEEFGYEDFVPGFKAENWDPEALVRFFKDNGAHFIMPVAVHHDNFDMYDSFHPWNAVDMGPKRDTIREWKEAATKYGLKFGVSTHLYWSPRFFKDARPYQKPGTLAWKLFNMDYDPKNYSIQDSWNEHWYARCWELIEKYDPDMFNNDSPYPDEKPNRGKSLGVKLFSSYLNRDLQENSGTQTTVLSFKNARMNRAAFTYNCERGMSGELQAHPWIWATDVSGGWFYRKGSITRMSIPVLIANSVDAISKNGIVMLNVALRGDGTLPENQAAYLRALGDWLKINGEGIYGSRPWNRFGEGPTQIKTARTGENTKPYKPQDIRFTTKDGKLYAFVLAPPTADISIKTLAKGGPYHGDIGNITMLGSSEKLKWKRSADALTIQLPKTMPDQSVIGFRISGLNAATDTPIETTAAKETRKQNRETRAVKRPQYLETGGERKLNVLYKKTPERDLFFDLYYPTGKRDAKCPVIVYAHGGGWAAGSRQGAANASFGVVFKQLVEKGFCVASVDYRLWKKEGTVSMRDCVIDSKDAVRYMSQNSKSLGIDPMRVYVMGDSAGGQIAQMLLLSSPERLPGDPALAGASYKMVAGVSWYGPCDFERTELFNHNDRPDFRDRFGPRIMRSDSKPEDKLMLYREMSPINYLTQASPPLLMIQGDKDTTIPVKHAYYMQEKAEALQAPVEIMIIKNAGHNWRKVDADIAPSRDVIIERTVQFFVDHL